MNVRLNMGSKGHDQQSVQGAAGLVDVTEQKMPLGLKKLGKGDGRKLDKSDIRVLPTAPPVEDETPLSMNPTKNIGRPLPPVPGVPAAQGSVPSAQPAATGPNKRPAATSATQSAPGPVKPSPSSASLSSSSSSSSLSSSSQPAPTKPAASRPRRLAPPPPPPPPPPPSLPEEHAPHPPSPPPPLPQKHTPPPPSPVSPTASMPPASQPSPARPHRRVPPPPSLPPASVPASPVCQAPSVLADRTNARRPASAEPRVGEEPSPSGSSSLYPVLTNLSQGYYSSIDDNNDVSENNYLEPVAVGRPPAPNPTCRANSESSNSLEAWVMRSEGLGSPAEEERQPEVGELQDRVPSGASGQTEPNRTLPVQGENCEDDIYEFVGPVVQQNQVSGRQELLQAGPLQQHPDEQLQVVQDEPLAESSQSVSQEEFLQRQGLLSPSQQQQQLLSAPLLQMQEVIRHLQERQRPKQLQQQQHPADQHEAQSNMRQSEEDVSRPRPSVPAAPKPQVQRQQRQQQQDELQQQEHQQAPRQPIPRIQPPPQHQRRRQSGPQQLSQEQLPQEQDHHQLQEQLPQQQYQQEQPQQQQRRQRVEQCPPQQQQRPEERQPQQNHHHQQQEQLQQEQEHHHQMQEQLQQQQYQQEQLQQQQRRQQVEQCPPHQQRVHQTPPPVQPQHLAQRRLLSQDRPESEEGSGTAVASGDDEDEGEHSQETLLRRTVSGRAAYFRQLSQGNQSTGRPPAVLPKPSSGRPRRPPSTTTTTTSSSSSSSSSNVAALAAALGPRLAHVQHGQGPAAAARQAPPPPTAPRLAAQEPDNISNSSFEERAVPSDTAPGNAVTTVTNTAPVGHNVTAAHSRVGENASEAPRPGVGESTNDAGRSGESTKSVVAVEKAVLDAFMDTPMVKEVLAMDVPEDLIRKAIERQIRRTGDTFSTPSGLLDAVFDQRPSTESNATNSSYPPVLSIKPEEINRLIDQRFCKICMDEEVCMVFMPCGHLACCKDCSDKLLDCPICRTAISQKVRAYLA